MKKAPAVLFFCFFSCPFLFSCIENDGAIITSSSGSSRMAADPDRIATQDITSLVQKTASKMLDTDLFPEIKTDKEAAAKPRLYVRNVRNYIPYDDINVSVVKEQLELYLINSRKIRMMDELSNPRYALDVEIASFSSFSDPDQAPVKYGAMLILTDTKDNKTSQWFDFVKRDKDGKIWY